MIKINTPTLYSAKMKSTNNNRMILNRTIHTTNILKFYYCGITSILDNFWNAMKILYLIIVEANYSEYSWYCCKICICDMSDLRIYDLKKNLKKLLLGTPCAIWYQHIKNMKDKCGFLNSLHFSKRFQKHVFETICLQITVFKVKNAFDV